MSQDNEKEIIFNELTSDIRPDLGMYGIEEVDRGICEDSYENRSILRTHRMTWNNVFDENGQPTGLIQILSPEMQAAKTRSTLEDRKALLTDDRDLNSDYLTEEALIIEEAADTLAPLWVIAQTRTWIRVREARKTDPKRMAQLEGPPTRCRYIKTDGIRCMLWCSGRVSDDGLCRTHLGTRTNNVTGAVAKARTRAYQAAPAALAVLENLMESAESEPVKLKAATEILDRAGIRGGVEIDAKVEVSERPAEEQIRERLMRLAPRLLTPDPEDEILEIETEATDD